MGRIFKREDAKSAREWNFFSRSHHELRSPPSMKSVRATLERGGPGLRIFAGANEVNEEDGEFLTWDHPDCECASSGA